MTYESIRARLGAAKNALTNAAQAARRGDMDRNLEELANVAAEAKVAAIEARRARKALYRWREEAKR